jgi:hypothetical protein
VRKRGAEREYLVCFLTKEEEREGEREEEEEGRGALASPLK